MINKNIYIITSCIYWHPKKNFNEFNDNYLNLLLLKISGEKENASLLSDFNVDLLKFHKDGGKKTFIVSLVICFCCVS